MLTGKIVKGIAGFYYVHDGKRVWACRAAGIFRKDGIKPLVGDTVEFFITDENDGEGNVAKVLPRKNRLIRPEVANIDQAMLVFAVASPDPSLGVLDRLLIHMEQQGLPCVIVFNKTDLKDTEEWLKSVYAPAGYDLIFSSMREKRGLEEIKKKLEGKSTVLAGPSGVGKSSLMNALLPEAEVRTGEVSRKIGRGRQTTRHSEIFCIDEGTYVLDTPGFTSFEVTGVDEYSVRDYYPEFSEASKRCRFPDCVHIGERECGVKEAVKREEISPVRYQNYKDLYLVVKNSRKY